MHLNPLMGLGCYSGLPHPRATATVLMCHDDFGNLVPTDRVAAYNSALPYGHCAATRVVHTKDSLQ